MQAVGALSRRGRSARGSAASAGGGGDAAGGGPDERGPQPHPCHRACLLCPHFDDDEDPFEKAVNGSIAFYNWGRPRDQNGSTVGNYCGYCVRWFNANVKGLTHEDGGRYTIEHYKVITTLNSVCVF